jgi:hypothetical protein
VLAYAGVLVYAVARASDLAGLVAATGLLGAVLLTAVLARGMEELLAWSLGVLGGAYTTSLAAHWGSVDQSVPLVAAALLLSGELAAWSLDERVRVKAEQGVFARRAGSVALLVGAGLAASAAAVAVSAAPAAHGLAWTTLGAAAAVCAVGAGVAIMRRSS